jgi:hypothetical protein
VSSRGGSVSSGGGSVRSRGGSVSSGGGSVRSRGGSSGGCGAEEADCGGSRLKGEQGHTAQEVSSLIFVESPQK